MLWFSRDPMIERIKSAMDYYMKKYQMMPNYCVVNPKEFVDGDMPCEVVASRVILPCHIWIGVKELSSNSNVDTV